MPLARSLFNKFKRLQEDLERLNLLNKERAKSISKKLVDYRVLPADSIERTVLTIVIMRLKLEQMM